MSTIENIYKICEERGITPWKLSNELGFSNGYFNMIKKQGSKMRADRVQAVADYFGITVDQLMGNDNRPTEINVLGRVAAGVPLEAVQHIIGTEEISAELAQQ